MITNEQLIEKFNPATAGQLSAEDLDILHNLTDEQLDILAKEYPNQANRKSYLRLYDRSVPAEKQLYQLSTWQNLRNVRKFSNRKSLIPWDFLTTATRFNQQPQRPVSASQRAAASSPRKVVVDLTAQEAANELKNSLMETAPLQGKAPEVKSASTKTTSPKKLTATQEGILKRQQKNKEKTQASPAISPEVGDSDNPPMDQQFAEVE